jgi:AcrR family transcriptional regulator
MKKKASLKRARHKQRRLSPDDRRKEFVAKATEFFAEQGFGGGTRDLARRLGGVAGDCGLADVADAEAAEGT